MDGLLYAVGGSAGAEYHNSVECYDPDQDTWTSVKSMHVKRLGVGVAVVNRYYTSHDKKNISQLLHINVDNTFE